MTSVRHKVSGGGFLFYGMVLLGVYEYEKAKCGIDMFLLYWLAGKGDISLIGCRFF